MSGKGYGSEFASHENYHAVWAAVRRAEFVFAKKVDRLSVEGLSAADFEIEVGQLDYGFELNGIIGMDWLTRLGAVIDLTALELRAGQA